MSTSKLTVEERKNVVKKIKNGTLSAEKAAATAGVKRQTIYLWCRKYKSQPIDILAKKSRQLADQILSTWQD